MVVDSTEAADHVQSDGTETVVESTEAAVDAVDVAAPVAVVVLEAGIELKCDVLGMTVVVKLCVWVVVLREKKWGLHESLEPFVVEVPFVVDEFEAS